MLKFFKKTNTNLGQQKTKKPAVSLSKEEDKDEEAELPDASVLNADDFEVERYDVRRDFKFPYERVYSVQVDLMSRIYCFLKADSKRLGLYSSPTGTGKSLTLICSILSFYRNPKVQPIGPASSEEREKVVVKPRPAKMKPKDDLEDWAQMFGAAQEQQAFENKKKSYLKKERAYEFLSADDVKEVKTKLLEARMAQRQEQRANRTRAAAKSGGGASAEDFTIRYDSDEDRKTQKMKEIRRKALSSTKDKQVIFCTRTHSQISQLISEIKKVPHFQDLIVVPLVSRKGLCVHPKLKDITNVNVLNDKCQTLCEKKQGCPHADCDLQDLLQDNLIEQIHDIEDLHHRSGRLNACGYFAAKAVATEAADVIVAPYQSILSESARSALGLSNLTGKILVFDEAHNLMDTITSLNSIEVTESQIQGLATHLNEYLSKYKKRMAPKNSKALLDILRIVQAFAKYFKSLQDQKESEGDFVSADDGAIAECGEKSVPVLDVLVETDLYSFDFGRLALFFEKADIVKKVNGFISAKFEQEMRLKGQSPGQARSSPNARALLYLLQDFLRVLQYEPKDGLFVVKDGGRSLQYLCLNPALQLKHLIDKAEKVMLASGTLEPTEEYDCLKKQAETSSTLNKFFLDKFSCPHVVPKQNFMAIPISKYGSLEKFDFRFGQRSNQQQLAELGSFILEVAERTSSKGGTVVFLQSYKFKEDFMAFLQAKGMLTKMEAVKKVFQEVKDSTDDVFSKYKQHIGQGKPAILFCVIGGRLSEGINFSDNLARTVIVCGLPYANSQSIEIREKMKYWDSAGIPSYRGSDFYDNMCIKQVNQAIGRAIRHKDDYALLFLVDWRFSLPKFQAKLSGWVQQSLRASPCGTKEEVQDVVTEFFGKAAK